MKKNIYLYLFVFASLIAFIFYINGRKYQSELEAQIVSMRKENIKMQQKTNATENNATTSSFQFEGNDKAIDILEKQDVNYDNLNSRVYDALLELNANKLGNPLIPVGNLPNTFRINDSKVINHKWVIANYADGPLWGEILLEYSIKADGKISFKTIESLLYN